MSIKNDANESDYDDSEFDNQPDGNFQFAQLPTPFEDYSSDAPESPHRSSQSPYRSSQSPFRSSQSPNHSSQTAFAQCSQVLNNDNASQEKWNVQFQLNEELQIGSSQSHCSQFYCSQTDEIAFCSQSIQGLYSQLNHPTDSSACAPLYANSVLSHIRANDLKFTPTSNIFENQEIIEPVDRENRVKWMIDNMIKLEVSVRAMYLCVRLFDKVISIINMDKDNIILYSVSCLGLGAKFENSFAQPVSSYAESSNQFNEDQIIDCEKEILTKLDFQISIPTEKFFLNMWTNQIQADETFGMMVAFISFCSFTDARIRSYTAEVVAAAIFHITVNTYDPEYSLDPIIDTAERFGAQKIKDCEIYVVESIQKVISDEDSTIKKMFSIPERKSVSIAYQYEVPLESLVQE